MTLSAYNNAMASSLITMSRLQAVIDQKVRSAPSNDPGIPSSLSARMQLAEIWHTNAKAMEMAQNAIIASSINLLV